MKIRYFSSKLKKLLFAIFLCLILIFFAPNEIVRIFRGAIFKITYPVQRTSYFLSQNVGNFFETLKSISDFKKKNQGLTEENLKLEAEIVNLKVEKKENEELRKQLNLAPKGQYEMEAAYVIGRESQELGSWIIIDKGKKHGLEEGMPLVVYEGILVGKISEVYDGVSKAVFLNDPQSSANVMDAVSGAKGILIGEFGLGLAMTMVQQTELLSVGDEIISSGLGGSVPKGLLVGNIQQVSYNTDKLFQKAIITPRVKYKDLETVFIIKKVK